MTGEDEGVAAAVAGELALHDPAVRTSPERSGALLADDFAEFGASGRRWDRAAVVAAMAGEGAPGEPVEVDRMRGVRLADDVVHLTYRARRGGQASLRSSLWRRTDGRWQLWFHQGTPVAGRP